MILTSAVRERHGTVQHRFAESFCLLGKKKGEDDPPDCIKSNQTVLLTPNQRRAEEKGERVKGGARVGRPEGAREHRIGAARVNAVMPTIRTRAS